MCAGGTLLAAFASGCAGSASRAIPSTGTPAAAAAPAAPAGTQGLNGGPRPSSIPLDTNPADPPVVITSENKARYVGLVTNRLPGTWDSRAWYARVAAAVGEPVARELSDPARPAEGSFQYWRPRLADVRDSSITVSFRDTEKVPASIQCVAQGFDPGDDRAVTQIASLFRLCAAADFPGAHPSAVQSWAGREGRLVLKDLQKHPSADVTTPVPAFGTGTYAVSGAKVGAYGFTIEFTIW